MKRLIFAIITAVMLCFAVNVGAEPITKSVPQKKMTSVVLLAQNEYQWIDHAISASTKRKEDETDIDIESILIHSEPILEDLPPETSITEKTTEPDPEDVELLAIAIYCEAGADYISDTTRYMVGDVILNRVADSRFPDTIAAVLTQKAQYGRFYWTGIVWPERAKNASEAHAVDRARQTARDLLMGNHSELYGEGYIYQAEFIQGKDTIKSDGIYFGR